MSSLLGPMAPPIISSDAVQGETFLPGQIFVFGGFTLRANSLGHLEQIESYAPGHQVRFGNLNYTADIRGDLIFDGFEPQPSAPHCHNGHDLALLPDNTLEAALEPASIFDSEPAAQRIMLVFGSIDSETAAPEAVSNHPSSIGVVGSKLRVGADIGAASWALSGGRARSCPS